MGKISIHNRNQIEILDVIRGLAVLLVLKSHWLYFDTKLFGWFEEYYLQFRKIEEYFLFTNRFVHPGVLIFIVLSGFIIHYTNGIASENADVGWGIKFILRRIARLFPVLALGLIFGLIVQYFFYADLSTEDFSRLWQNSVFLYGIKYIHPPTINNILVTVESEFWLYLFYAIVFRFLKSYRAWFVVLCISFTIWILNYYLNIARVGLIISDYGIWTRNNFFAYLIYWMIGAFAAEIAKKKLNFQISWFMPIALFLVVLALIPSQKYLWQFLLNELILASAIGIILVKLVSVKPNDLIAGTFGLIGKVGYSIYAFHMCFIMMFISSSMQIVSSTYFSPPFVLIYTLVGSSVFYYFFERPIHLRTNKMFKKIQ